MVSQVQAGHCPKLVVRNTFVDVVDEAECGDDLFRTMSDPSGRCPMQQPKLTMEFSENPSKTLMESCVEEPHESSLDSVTATCSIASTSLSAKGHQAEHAAGESTPPIALANNEIVRCRHVKIEEQLQDYNYNMDHKIPDHMRHETTAASTDLTNGKGKTCGRPSAGVQKESVSLSGTDTMTVTGAGFALGDGSRQLHSVGPETTSGTRLLSFPQFSSPILAVASADPEAGTCLHGAMPSNLLGSTSGIVPVLGVLATTHDSLTPSQAEDMQFLLAADNQAQAMCLTTAIPSTMPATMCESMVAGLVQPVAGMSLSQPMEGMPHSITGPPLPALVCADTIGPVFRAAGSVPSATADIRVAAPVAMQAYIPRDAQHSQGDEHRASMMPRQSCPFGSQHRFHEETRTMGLLSEDARHFTKMEYQGRLSIVTEDTVHSYGKLHYAVQFASGTLSSADGVGFIFSPKLPCSKNIQRIVSVFVNSAGQICLRAGARVVRSNMSLKPLKVGDWITVELDFSGKTACFTLYPSGGGASSSVLFPFGPSLETFKKQTNIVSDTLCGYFACVVKNLGVSLALGS